MESKQLLLNFLRKIYLLKLSNLVGLKYNQLKNQKKNLDFATNHPDFNFPPTKLIYEVFGRTSYERYFLSGQNAAKNLITLFKKYKELDNAKILEWGCGVSRILRHVKEFTKESNVELFGSDLDDEMIEWCKSNLNDINFSTNNLLPPLEYSDESFDIIYCTSVFTHLTEDVQFQWLDEIKRVLKKDGLFVFTTHGDFYANQKLSFTELDSYNKGNFILRSKVENGSKLMTTFQNADYVKKRMLDSRFKLKEHLTDKTLQLAGSQDIWIVMK